MLSNIFLLIGKNFYDLNHLDIYSYPEDITRKKDTNFIQRIIFGHNHSSDPVLADLDPSEKHTGRYRMDDPIAQIIDDLNIYTTCLNSEIIIGLILDKDDNYVVALASRSDGGTDVVKYKL